MTQEDPLAWFVRAATKLHTLWLQWTYPFASFGKGIRAHLGCRVTWAAARHIHLGDGVILGRGVRIDVCPNPGADPPVLILEKGTGVQRRCAISVQNRVHVMQHVIMGPGAVVMDHSDGLGHSTEPAGRQKEAGKGTIRIEEGCWIGSRARIVCEQGELIIGRHSVVGANCLITQNIPCYSVVMGDPPSIVKQYDYSKCKWVMGCIRTVYRRESEPNASALS